jgi:hypothetical protein
MSKTVKIFNATVFCIWIALLSLLLYKNYSGTLLEKPLALADAFGKETYWYDAYVGNKKVGYASTAYEKAGDELIIKYEREIKVKKNGKDSVLLEKLKCLCSLSYSIKSFEYGSHLKDESGIKVRGEVGPDSIIFFLESSEKRKVYKIPRKDFYFPVTLIPVLVQQKPAAGAVFTIPFLNIGSLAIDDARVVLDEIRPVKVGMDIFSIYKFKSENTTWWANEKGLVVKEKSPIGITLYSQVEKFAKDPSDRVLFDYTSLPYIKSNKIIENPEILKTLKVRVNGFPLQTSLYENSPVTLRDKTLTIQKIDGGMLKEKSYKLPFTGDQFKRYLSPDKWVMSNYKPLEDTGRIYAKSNKNDAFLFTNYLASYVFQLVRTRPLFVLSDSKNFLDSLSGDYMERTVMFATYARAAGLPTRLVGGLVYLNGYFYFHTWPEVWFGRWVPVDPTLAQFPADVTHIPLKEGTLEDITSIVDDLKSTTIEILEAS